MPRVRTYKTVNRPGGAAPHTCDKCHQPIEPGQRRYEWKFRYGGTYRRHVACGRPRQSELTQSNLSTLYSAQEAIEDACENQPSTVEDFGAWRDEVEAALSNAAETARDTGAEYETAAEPFGNQGPNQDRYEACEAWADELDDAASDVQGTEPDLPEREDFTGDDADDDYEQAVTDAVETAADEVSGRAQDASGTLEL